MSNDAWPQHPGGEEGRKADILHRFAHFDLTQAQKDRIDSNGGMFSAIAGVILHQTKPGREQSLALTALEEAKYWTNQSIAKDGVPAS